MRRSAVVLTLIAALTLAGSPAIGPGTPVAGAAKKSKKVSKKKKAQTKRLRNKCAAKGGTWHNKTRKCAMPPVVEEDQDDEDSYEGDDSYETEPAYDIDSSDDADDAE